MRNKIKLSIKKPCSEKYDNFIQINNNGFCNSCQKTVIDFTKMSDSEISNYFKNSTQKTCGRFHQEQLKTYVQNTTNYSPYINKLLGRSFLGFSLVSLLSIYDVNAQQIIKSKKEIYENLNKTDSLKSNKEVSALYLKSPIKGIIKSENLPLPGASIWVEGTSIGAVSDFDGNFSINNRLKIGDVLVFSFLGLETKRCKLSSDQNLSITLNVNLNQVTCLTLGEVAVQEIYSSKKSFWKRRKKKK